MAKVAFLPASAPAAGLGGGGTGVFHVGLATAAATNAPVAAAVVVGDGGGRLPSGKVTSVPVRRVGSSLPINLPRCGKITPVPVVQRRLPSCPINPLLRFLFGQLDDQI